MCGQQQRLKMEAIQEMKAKVQKEVQEEDRTQLARQLMGPRGGLPTLKDDLVLLAHLIYVEVEPKDTVAILQAKVRPVVATLKENKRSWSAGAFGFGDFGGLIAKAICCGSLHRPRFQISSCESVENWKTSQVRQ